VLNSIVWKQTQHTARALDPSVSLFLCYSHVAVCLLLCMLLCRLLP